GSRRMGQYEMAALTIAAPPVALGLDGPAAVFNPPASSANFFVNGTDSGSSGYTSSGGTGTCTATGAVLPAITTGDATGVANIDASLVGPPNRAGQYTGAGGTPSVVNGGSSTFSGEWSSPAELDNLVSSIANIADQTYTCGIGTPCSPSGT